MRNMSFALTTDQVRQQTKTVTRRLGWKTLKPDTLIQPVVKGMGLKKGETVERIGGPIRVLNVRREPLNIIGARYLYARVGDAVVHRNARGGRASAAGERRHLPVFALDVREMHRCGVRVEPTPNR